MKRKMRVLTVLLVLVALVALPMIASAQRPLIRPNDRPEPVFFRLYDDDEYTVPAGMRLHIEFMTVRVEKGANVEVNDVVAYVRIQLAESGYQVRVAELAPFAGPYPVALSPNHGYYRIAQYLSIYAEENEKVKVGASEGTTSIFSFIHGTLERIAP